MIESKANKHLRPFRFTLKLQLFAHMSTSYCHLNEKMLLEKPYAPPADPHKIIGVVEALDEAVVHSMTKK